MIATPSVPPVPHTQLRNTKKRRTRIFGSTKNEMPGGGLVLKPRIHANRGIKKGDIVLYQLSRISPLCCLHRRIRAPHSKGSRDTIMASQTSLKITNRSGKDVKVYLTLGGGTRGCVQNVATILFVTNPGLVGVFPCECDNCTSSANPPQRGCPASRPRPLTSLAKRNRSAT